MYSSRSNVVRIRTRADASAARIRRVASRPSSSGMRMSISTTVGRKRAAFSTASSAVAGLGDDLDVLLAGEEHAEAGADHRLVVGDEDADAHARPSAGEGKARAEHEAAAVLAARAHLAAVDLDALAHAREAVAGPSPGAAPTPSSRTTICSSSGA